MSSPEIRSPVKGKYFFRSLSLPLELSIPYNHILMKFSIDNNLSDIDVIARAYHGTIQNVTDEAIIVSATDSSARIMNFIKVMQKFNPLEVVRSGIVAMER